jgi:hypothetical protein
VGVWAYGLPAELAASQARLLALDLAARGADVIAFGVPVGPLQAPVPVAPRLGAAPEEQGLSGLDTLAWDGFRDGLDEANYARMLTWYARNAEGLPQPAMEAGAPAYPPKRSVLERLASLGASRPATRTSILWNGLRLVDQGRPTAAIVMDPAAPDGRAQADMLSEMVSAKCGAGLPVLSVQDASSPHGWRLLVVLGSPETSPILRQLVAGDPELAWRIGRSGTMFVRFSHAGVPCLGLLAARPEQVGRLTVRFGALLRQEGGWVSQ